MAMFWEYVKGLNGSGSGSEAPIYTFLDYQKGAVSNTSENILPKIILNSANNNNTNNGAIDFGHIIVQGQSGADLTQHINSHIDFAQKAIFGDYSIKNDSNNNLSFYIDDNSTISLSKTQNKLVVACPTEYNSTLTANNGISVTANGIAVSGGDVVVSNGKCEALYFNALSDKRAKTDIQPLSINALNIINDTQLYSFRYKDMDTPSIGIIAQDIQNIDINGFKLVDNENASGQDMDYMTVHESKLVYILWKAIQEQQKEIDELKKRG